MTQVLNPPEPVRDRQGKEGDWEQEESILIGGVDSLPQRPARDMYKISFGKAEQQIQKNAIKALNA